MRNSKIISILVLCLIVSFAGPVWAELSDCKGHWAGKSIDGWVNNGYAKGYPDGTFRPDNSISRAEFTKMVNSVFGYTGGTEGRFTDVSRYAWYYESVAKAKEMGYISGYEDGSFKPNDPVNRQEAAVMLARLLKLSMSGESNLDRFSDKSSVSLWSKKAVSAMLAKNYMVGYPDNTFRPFKSVTRAEAIAMLDRASSYAERLQPDETALSSKDPKITANALADYTINMNKPLHKQVDSSNNTWTLKVTNGTLMQDVSEDDLSVYGLPGGLTINAKKGEGNTIVIEVSGEAHKTVDYSIKAQIVIESSAVVESSAEDSSAVEVMIVPGIYRIAGRVADSTVTVKGPDNKSIDSNNNSWTIVLTRGRLDNDFDEKDLIVYGLPDGLKIKAEAPSKRKIIITVSGSVKEPITSTAVNLVVRSNAVEGKDLTSSDYFPLTIDAGTAAKLEVTADKDEKTVRMLAPESVQVDEYDCTWTINVKGATLKDTITDKDLYVKNLPTGLWTKIVRKSGSKIEITVYGTVSSAIKSTVRVDITVKGSAVKDSGFSDAEPIDLYIKAS